MQISIPNLKEQSEKDHTQSINMMEDVFPSVSTQTIPEHIRSHFKKNITPTELSWGQCVLKDYEKPPKKRTYAISTQKICIFADSSFRWQLLISDLSELYISLFFSQILMVSLKKRRAFIIDTFLQNRKEIVKKINWSNKSIKVKQVHGTFLDIQQKKAFKEFDEVQKKQNLDQNLLQSDQDYGDSNLGQIRFINSIHNIDLQKMKKRFLNTQEQLGKINRLNDYQILGELLVNQHWSSYLGKKKNSNPKQQKRLRHIMGQLLTIKVYDKSKLAKDQGLLSYVMRESFNLQKVTTPYIPTVNRIFTTQTQFVIVCNLYQGLLINEVFDGEKTIQKDEQLMKNMIGQIVVALGHLHECGLNYGQVSSRNILVNHDGHILLVDLGSCCKPQEPVNKLPIHSSPEQILTKIASKSSDWWLLGLLIYEIVNKKSIFDGCKSKQQIIAILKNRSDKLKICFDSKVDPKLVSLTQDLLQKNSDNRLGSKNDYHEVLGHAYLKGVDKKKLMRRDGPILKKLRIKDGKDDIQIKKGSQGNRRVDEELKKCLYSKDLDG